MLKHFILRANTNDDYYENRAVAFVVAIDQEIKTSITSMSTKVMELKKLNHSIYNLSIFDASPIGIPSGVIEDEDLLEKLDTCEKEAIEITKKAFDKIIKAIPESEEIRLEAVTMHLDGDSVKWMGYYKHSNILVESGNLFLKDL